MSKKHEILLRAYLALALLISASPLMASSAKFLPLDSNTIGNWVGVYGHDGYVIANDATNLPTYATFAPSAATPYTWAYPSTDPRALLTSPVSSTRIASTYYTSTTCSFSINLSDGRTHQIALYLMDIETNNRVETISILDAATNAALDSRTMSGFHGGVYAIWNIQGNVIVQVTYNSGLNAVVGALFFDPASAGGSSPPPSVSITSPAGGTLSGTVTVTASASAAAGMSSVQFQLDGSNLGAAIAGSGPYSISWDSTKATNASHTLTAIATDTLNQPTTSAAVTVTVNNSSGAGGPSATFLSTDLTTKGSWKGVYGGNGYVIASDSNNPPSYATVNWNATPAYTWAASTTDVRALIKGASATDRIASTYYSSTSFTIDLNLTDNQSHTIALYCLDDDNQNRSQNITILNGVSGAVLDGPRGVTSFSGGEYLIWNLQGHVRIQIANAGPMNAVVSGLFFGNSGIGVSNTPPTVSMTNPTGGSVSGTVTASATAGATTAGATISSVQFQVDGVNLGSAVTGPGPGYSTSWNTTAASNAKHNLTAIATDSLNQKTTSTAVSVTVANSTPPPTISITSPAGGNVSGTVTVTASASAAAGMSSVQFQLDGSNLGAAITGSGPYSLSWDTTKATNASHTLTAIATDTLNQPTTSAVVTVTVNNSSGGAPSATFLSTDATTKGNWKGVYGGNGYVIANDSNNPPSYATVNWNATPAYTWAASTTDVRALIKGASATDRIASTYYSSTSFTIDLNLTDNQSHTIALYCLDDDYQNRSQNITILNGATGTVLDGPRSVTSFSGGEYLVWNLQGHVRIQVANASTINAVVSGLFFGNSGTGVSNTPPTISLTNPTGASVSGTVTVSATASATTAGATISSVQFQVDGVNLGSAVTSPGPGYSTSWNTTTASNAKHSLTAIATDSLNQKTTSTAVSVTVANSTPPPTISITSPTGGNVSGTVAVTASASAAAGMSSVQFQLDGSNLGAAITGSGPYSISWDTTKATNASHTLTAIATDTLNQPTTSAAVAVTVNNNSGAGSSATYVTTDTTTQGSWKGVYGQDGYVIASDSNNPPAYASLGVTGGTQFAWASTNDPRALQEGSSATTRIASAFYATPGFTMNLNATDGQSHVLALYFLDWDNEGRAETVTLLNAGNQAVLDTRVVSGFQNGKYLVWNIKGAVTIQFTLTSGANAVVSGVFLSSPVSLNPPTLSLTNTSIAFQGTAGAANPAGQSVMIANTGGGTLNWTASKTQSWLALSAGSGTAPSSLGLSVSTSLLSAGTYTDTVTIASTGANGTPQTVTVTLTLIPPPALTLSATSAAFSGTTGATNPTGQTVNITNTGGGTLNWTASKTQSWLTLSAGSGTAPSALGLSVSNAGLTSGTYTDTVTISASGATGSPRTVTVTLTLTPPPALNLSITSASFSGTTGAANPTGQSVTITNTGGGTLNWSATKTQSWLTLSANSGTAPSSLGLSISNTGLISGTYTDTVTISGTGATGSPQAVTVTLTLIPPPALNLSTTSASFAGTAGAANPTGQSVMITNTGGGTLNWTATKTQSWLTLSANAGTAPSSLGLTISNTGLASGTYSDTVTITGTGAVGSPQTVTVTLTLLPPPVLTLSTTAAAFSGTTGAANPTGQSVTITNTGGQTLNWTATNTQPWLTLSAGSGTAPSSLGLTISNTGLASGTYSDTITISGAGAVGSPQTVTVTLTLIPPPALTLSTTSVGFSGAMGGANPTGQNVNITNTGGGTLNWTATNTQSWLTLSAGSGTAPSSLGLSISNAGLAAGTYTDTVTISASGAVGSPQTVSVTLVLIPPPILTLSTTGLNPSGTVLGPNPTAQTVTITNTGGGTLNWMASKTQSWVTLSATSGTAPSSLVISFVTTGLAIGTYSDTVTVTAAGALGSPQTVSVTLIMAAPVTPIANWTFDTGTISGNTVLDISGNGIYGNIVGKVVSVPGEVNQALAFDGSTGYVLVPPNVALSMRNNMTMAAWIQTTNSTRIEVLAEDYNTNGSEDGYIFETTAAGYVALHLGGDNLTGNIRDYVDGTNRINDGKWHHVAVIIRPGEDISFYVDGGLSSVYYVTSYNSSSINSLGLGGPSLGGGYLFTGSMDEVRVYGYALTTSEIAGLYGGTVTTVPGGQILYNGIAMPKNFPPPTTATQMYRTPYYINNPPRVIPIDLGRQLFVDDFLIAQTTLQRTQHQPTILPVNPIFTPGTPISAGVWFDPTVQLYKMWYYNTTNDYRYTYSTDGINWTIPSYTDVLVPNTNEVVPGGDTIWLDWQETDMTRRYKAFQVDVGALKVYMYFSSDGIHWGPRQDFNIATLSDRTTFFWNPFRNVWVNSDRDSAGVSATAARAAYDPRVRFYSESTNLTTWTPANPANSFMAGPDDHDPPYYLNNPGGEPPELYNMDAVAYESVMVGLYSWFYPGYPYDDYTLPGPVLVELGVGFSRDGFSWVRPTRGSGPGPGGAFIPASNAAGTWNAYNTQSVGGGFLVVGDNLYFYFSGRTLQKPLDGVFSTGLAELRRDGFYSMDAGGTQGTLTTNPIKFSGNHLFVNVSDPSGSLYVEVLDQNGDVIAPFSKANCTPLSVDKTLQEVTWSGATDLSSLAGQTVQFKFYLTNGELYSFWVTPSSQGASYGYIAAGGPGLTGVTDTVGAGAQ